MTSHLPIAPEQSARSRRLIAPAIMLAALILAGCSTAPRTQAKKQTLEDKSQATVNRFERTDPGLTDLLNRSYGYVVFPNVGKGGAIVGGAYGKGVAYEQGKRVGFADLTQATVGAQLGGATFAEIVVFENQEAMQRFKNNQLSFTANASAVALKSGAAKSTHFENGVAVFTDPNEGLMFEAAVGGQKFTFVSNAVAGATTEPASDMNQ